MRILFFFLFIIGCSSLYGQKISLVGPDGGKLQGVAVTVYQPSAPLQHQQYISDSSGSILVGVSFPIVVAVNDMRYESLTDTILKQQNKQYALSLRILSGADVVVTGQYSGRSAANAVQRIEVIDNKTITAMAAQNLRDVLVNQQEIRLSQDGILGASMNIQGGQGYAAGTKILIDGVPIVGKQNGSVDLTQISMSNVERIEIVKGPMSVSYGTDAVSGTINIITKKFAKPGFDVLLNHYFETIGTYNLQADVAYHKKQHTLRLSSARNFFNGWNLTDKPECYNFSRTSADTNRTQLWKPREQYMNNMVYTYNTSSWLVTYKLQWFQEKIWNRGEPMAPYYEQALDNIFYTRRLDNTLLATYTTKRGNKYHLVSGYNAYKRLKETFSKDLTTLATSTITDDQDTSKYSELTVRAYTTGAYKEKWSYELGYDANVQTANSSQITNRRQDMQDHALFASAEYKPTASITIRPGIRAGYNTRYSMPLVPSINFMFKPKGHWTMRLSYGKGYRRPDLKELYFDFVDVNHNIRGNTNLKAEQSDNFSSSITYTNNVIGWKYSFVLGGYRNNFTDLITLAAVAGGSATEYSYSNIGVFKTQGANLTLDAQKGGLNFSVGGAYMGTYNQYHEVSATPQFTYSPEFRTSVMYRLEKLKLSFALFAKYTGQFYSYITDNNSIKQVRSEAYSMADISATKTLFNDALTIALGCKNLLDVKNINSYSSGNAHSGASGVMSIATGRYYFLKLGWHFAQQKQK